MKSLKSRRQVNNNIMKGVIALALALILVCFLFLKMAGGNIEWLL